MQGKKVDGKVNDDKASRKPCRRGCSHDVNKGVEKR